MLKLVDRSRLGRGEFIHISSSLITHKYNINVLYCFYVFKAIIFICYYYFYMLLLFLYVIIIFICYNY
jgi:hypothetical protein